MPPLFQQLQIFSLNCRFFLEKQKVKTWLFWGVKNDFDPISGSDSMDDKPVRKI